MKCITAAALLPLALAVNINPRQATDLKYEISGFAAACTPESINCFYEIGIITSNNPEFYVGCEAMGTSDNGKLPAVSKTQCGTYTIAVAKSDDGGLVLTVNSARERLTGTYTISSDDLTTTTSGESTVQSYTGNPAFTIDVKKASPASTPTTLPISSASSSASSVSPTATSEPSTTGTTTSDPASPSETNAATRESAFTGIPFAVSLMAFIF